LAGLPRRARHGLILAIVGVLGAAMLAPVVALADTNLEVGGEAIVAYANGDNVRFRESPDYGAQVIDMVPEGTMVDVYYGPITADDGSLWYEIGIDGQHGYMVADYLAVPDGNGNTIPANATVLDAAGSASADGIAEGTVVAVAVIAGTNGDGVRCRADASTGAAVITVLPEGTSVELTGDAVDGWQPVNCAGQGGFVSTDYVSYDGSGGASSDVQVAAPTAQSSEDFGAASVTGTAIVVGTNGGGLRCRAKANTNADIITVFPEGSEVELRGDASGSWQPVFCDGSAGYASTDYLSYDGTGAASSSGDASGSSASTGLATIGDTQGDGLRCRSGAGYDSSVIVVLREGSTVELRGNLNGAWQPVICAGQNGFVHSDYLVYDGGAGGDSTSSAGDSSGGDQTTGTARVGDTNGGGLRCRAGAGFDADILTVLPEGTTVELRGDASGAWQPVLCDGQKGFVHTDYLVYGGASSSGSSSSSGGGSNSSLSAGDVAEVSGTNGDGVRFRSGPSTSDSVISVLPEGTVVDVIAGSTGDWVAVSYNGSDGYVHMDYLVLSDGSSGGGGGSSGSNTKSSGGGGGLSDGDHAVTTAALNLRYDASLSAGVAAVAPEGTVVEITGGADNGFYPVDWDGLRGFMYGDYLSATNADLSVRGGSGAPSGDGGGVSGGGGGGGGSATGEAIANYAMQYLGYPYVWATHGPSSFDCSGFTYWVVLNTLGIDIGTGLWTQVSAGTSVSQSDLQPGDLVFFQNTYEWGLSHVGIYIGNGQFIHAENESTGVVISSLSSSYYSSRWYGAVRLA
jgi:cell wall-associated NlpC family hydrolase